MGAGCGWHVLHVIVVTVVARRVRKIAKSDYYLRHVCQSVLPGWNKPAPTGRIFIELDI
jgi:hypothetical protein